MKILDMRGFLNAEAGQPLLKALQKHYGDDVEVITSDTEPKNAAEWLTACQTHGEVSDNSAVLLPGEKPLPIPAVEAGYQHIAVMPDGIFRLKGQEVRDVGTRRELILVMEKITK